MLFDIFNTFVHWEYLPDKDICQDRDSIRDQRCRPEYFNYREQIEHSLIDLKASKTTIVRTGLFSQEAYDAMMLITAIEKYEFDRTTDKKHGKKIVEEVPGFFYQLSHYEQNAVRDQFFSDKRFTQENVEEFKRYVNEMYKPRKITHVNTYWCKTDPRDFTGKHWSSIESIIRLEAGEICLVFNYYSKFDLSDFVLSLKEDKGVMRVMNDAVKWFGTDTPTIATWPALLDVNSYNYGGSSHGLFHTNLTVNINTIRKLKMYFAGVTSREIDAAFGKGSYDRLVGGPCYTPFVTLDAINDVRQSFHPLIVEAARKYHYLMVHESDEYDDFVCSSKYNKCSEVERDRILDDIKSRRKTTKASAKKVIRDARAKMARELNKIL